MGDLASLIVLRESCLFRALRSGDGELDPDAYEPES